jgi:phosphatidylinositol alpha-1,6-mannosyltransferase
VVLQEIGIAPRQHLIQTVPLGTDPLRFRPDLPEAEIRSRYDLHGRRWLLSVARLTRHKGIDTGILALAGLAPEYPDLGYAIAGSGDELPGLKKLAAELGIADRVRFLANVPDRDLPGLYNCAEVYLGLSRLMNERVEGFGISLLEAGACGIPVVGTRTGGIPEAVRDGESGILVDSDQPDQVAATLRTLLDDRSLAERLGAGGRSAVERYYNWDRVSADIARLGRNLGRPVLRKVVR